MGISENGLDLIKSFESCILTGYLCPAGKLTIGYGHVIQKGEIFTKITADEAEQLLIKDCALAENCIKKNITAALNQHQFDALISFIFNIGCSNFSKSTLLQLINREDYHGASEQFTRWIFAGGVALDGLLRRRQAEKKLFLTL